MTVTVRNISIAPQGIIRWLGGAGDGVTDDTAAVLAACAYGNPVDGGGLTYGVSGTLQLATNFKGLRNCKLKQLAPSTANCKTLYILSTDDWVIEDCEIDCGAYFTGGSISANAGIKAELCNNWRISHNRIYNGGPMNGIWARQCDNGQIIGNTIEDFTGDPTPEATDDCIQGINTQASTYMRVQNNLVRNLLVYVTPAGGPTTGVRALHTRYARGFVFSGIDSGVSNNTLTVTGNVSISNDQGYDYTGTLGSTHVIHANNWAIDNGTYGFKFTGASRNFTIANNRSLRAGKIGLIITGHSNLLQPPNGFLDVSGNVIEEPGYDGLWTDGTWGAGGTVGIFLSVGIDVPQGIKIAGNTVYASNGKLVSGIVAQGVTTTGEPDSTISLDEMIGSGNTVVGAGYLSGADFSGFQSLSVDLTGTGNQTVTDATWTSMTFATETEDTANIHSTTSNATQVYFPRDGWYVLVGTATFPANATGIRGLQFYKNGAAIVGAKTEQVPHATLATTISLTTMIHVSRDDHSICAMYQDSGGSLTCDRTKTRFVAKYCGP